MKIAVFSTSEIQKFEGMTRNLISTGLLEKAIKLGYTIYVITSRTKFSELDDWWLSKIEKLYTGYNGYGAGDVAFIETWKQFYQDRGIDLNDLKIRRIENELSDSQIDQGTSWMEYQNNLKIFGIKRGIDFIEKDQDVFDVLN